MNKTTLQNKYLIFGFIIIIISACAHNVATEREVIRLEINQTDFRTIVNNTSHDIEIYPPIQEYFRGEVAWSHYYYRDSSVFPMGFFDTIVIATKSDRNFEGNYEDQICSQKANECDYFSIVRYTIPELPGHVFAIYSNEGQLGDLSLMEISDFDVSPSSTNPFHFTVHSAYDQMVWICWTPREKREELGWSQVSRLERQTEEGTWEIFPHSLELCGNGDRNAIVVPPNDSIPVDGAQAYPEYKDMPIGTYRWVIIVDGGIEFLEALVFSPRFYWDGTTTTIQD